MWSSQPKEKSCLVLSSTLKGILSMKLTAPSSWDFWIIIQTGKNTLHMCRERLHEIPRFNDKSQKTTKFWCIDNIVLSLYHHELLSDIFHDYFQCVRNVHSHNTLQNCGLYTSHMKTDLGQTCIGYPGPVIWKKILGIQIPLRSHLKKHWSNASTMVYLKVAWCILM